MEHWDCEVSGVARVGRVNLVNGGNNYLYSV